MRPRKFTLKALMATIAASALAIASWTMIDRSWKFERLAQGYHGNMAYHHRQMRWLTRNYQTGEEHEVAPISRTKYAGHQDGYRRMKRLEEIYRRAAKYPWLSVPE